MQIANNLRIKPDINNPELCSDACNKDYRTKYLYMRHINYAHCMFITFKVAAKQEGTIPHVDDPNYQCNGYRKVLSISRITHPETHIGLWCIQLECCLRYPWWVWCYTQQH